MVIGSHNNNEEDEGDGFVAVDFDIISSSSSSWEFINQSEKSYDNCSFDEKSDEVREEKDEDHLGFRESSPSKYGETCVPEDAQQYEQSSCHQQSYHQHSLQTFEAAPLPAFGSGVPAASVGLGLGRVQPDQVQHHDVADQESFGFPGLNPAADAYYPQHVGSGEDGFPAAAIPAEVVPNDFYGMNQSYEQNVYYQANLVFPAKIPANLDPPGMISAAPLYQLNVYEYEEKEGFYLDDYLDVELIPFLVTDRMRKLEKRVRPKFMKTKMRSRFAHRKHHGLLKDQKSDDEVVMVSSTSNVISDYCEGMKMIPSPPSNISSDMKHKDIKISPPSNIRKDGNKVMEDDDEYVYELDEDEYLYELDKKYDYEEGCYDYVCERFIPFLVSNRMRKVKKRAYPELKSKRWSGRKNGMQLNLTESLLSEYCKEIAEMSPYMSWGSYLLMSSCNISLTTTRSFMDDKCSCGGYGCDYSCSICCDRRWGYGEEDYDLEETIQLLVNDKIGIGIQKMWKLARKVYPKLNKSKRLTYKRSRYGSVLMGRKPG